MGRLKKGAVPMGLLLKRGVPFPTLKRGANIRCACGAGCLMLAANMPPALGGRWMDGFRRPLIAEKLR